MITMSSIKLYRAEGPIAKIGPAGPFSTWAQADGQLAQWAQTAPEPGQGYNKVDFEVVWADGESYSGRYDMNRWGEDSERDGHDLARHIRQFLVYLAHACPNGHTNSQAAEAKTFLAERFQADSVVHPARQSFPCCKGAA